MRPPRQILLAEDDPRDVELIREALEDAGLVNALDVVADGVEALAYLRREGAHAGRPPGDPAVVLLDLKMPRLDGLETVARIRADEAIRYVPVVILTSSEQEKDRLEGYARGANAYVVKPVRFADFAEAVRQIGLFWAVLNAPPGAAGGPA